MHATEEEVPGVITAIAAAAETVPPPMEGVVQAPETVVTLGEALEGAEVLVRPRAGPVAFLVHPLVIPAASSITSATVPAA